MAVGLTCQYWQGVTLLLRVVCHDGQDSLNVSSWRRLCIWRPLSCAILHKSGQHHYVCVDSLEVASLRKLAATVPEKASQSGSALHDQDRHVSADLRPACLSFPLTRQDQGMCAGVIIVHQDSVANLLDSMCDSKPSQASSSKSSTCWAGHKSALHAEADAMTMPT